VLDDAALSDDENVVLSRNDVVTDTSGTRTWHGTMMNRTDSPYREVAVTIRFLDRIRFNNHPQVGARMAKKAGRRLRFSNRLNDDVAAGIENHMNFSNVKKMRVNTLKRLLRRPTFKAELELHRADCEASHSELGNFRFLKRKNDQTDIG